MSIVKMRAAQIPRQALSTNAKDAKFPEIRAIIDTEDWKTASGLKTFVVEPAGIQHPDRTFLAVGLFAKELVLKGESVYFCTFADIVRCNRLQEKGIDYSTELHDRKGSGFIAVVGVAEAVGVYPGAELLEAQAYLLSHVARGGGLILDAPFDDLTLSRLMDAAFLIQVK